MCMASGNKDTFHLVKRNQNKELKYGETRYVKNCLTIRD